MKIIEKLDDLFKSCNYFSNGIFINIPLLNRCLTCEVLKGPLFNTTTSSYNRPASYVVLNSLTGEMYIGSTSDIRKRMKAHRSSLIRGDNDSKGLQKSFNNVNKNYMDLCIIFTSNREEAYDVEQYLIDVYKNEECFLNTAINARSAMKDVKLSEEQCKQRSLSLTGRPVTLETRLKMRNSSIGKTMSSDARNKMSEAKKHLSIEARSNISKGQLGKKLSDEHKNKIKNALIGRPINRKTIQAVIDKNSKSIIANGVFYKNYRIATKTLGVGKNTIRRRIKNKIPGYNYIDNK